MILKLNDNRKTLIFIIACFFLVMLLNLIQLKNVYASEPNLTEIEKEYPNASSVISDNSSKYPYYICCNLDKANGSKNRFICFSDKPLLLSVDNLSDTWYWSKLQPKKLDFVFYREDDYEIICYDYNFTSNKWEKGYSEVFNSLSEYNYVLFYSSSDNYLTFDKINYTNYDLKTKNGTVVFQNARYQGTSIIGGITSKSIWTILLKTISGITVLVVGFLVSVIAFRKGWKMLKTVLVGA